MKNMLKIMIGCFVVLMVASFADAQTTVTNRGQVISIQTLADTADAVANTNLYQDSSIYPSRLGEAGKIIRFYDSTECGVGTNVNLLPAIKIPDNTLIRNGYYQVMTAGALLSTNALWLNTAADILASGSNSMHTAAGGRFAIVPVGTAGTAVQASGAQYLKASITGVTPTNLVYMVVLDVELAP
jgi:hypothetical protein